MRFPINPDAVVYALFEAGFGAHAGIVVAAIEEEGDPTSITR